MHPRHGDDEATRTDRLIMVAVTLLFALLVGAAIKFDLWQVPEDYSAAILIEDGTTPQSVATAQKVDQAKLDQARADQAKVNQAKID
ncbi:MAG TPA: hypothetical protein VHT04_01050 [Stellaceae bacterium]|nr:hypothetical protein [Stellaceae bacterium]